MQSICIY